MEEMVELLRIQRHDFMNHLQVVSGLLQLGKADKAREYIYKISESMTAEGRITRLALPSLTVCLLVKRQQAAKKGIAFRWQINTELKNTNFPEEVLVQITDWALSKALEQSVADTTGEISLEILSSDKEYNLKYCWQPGDLSKIDFDNIKKLAEKHGIAFTVKNQASLMEVSITFPRHK